MVGYGPVNNNAFVYSNGIFSNLNDLIDQPGLTLTNAYGINDAGWIVASGYSDEHGYGGYLVTPVPEPAGAIVVYSALICALPLASKALIRCANITLRR